ncbi:MAG TPA: PAS domain-containing protein [Actinomycetota bacterium]|nr:PAS domain-containing protein [Actinomycetota bacterium]
MEAAHQRATTTAGELTFLALLDRALAGCGSVDAVASALLPAVAERSFAIGGVLWVADRYGALETAGRFPATGAGREPDPVFAMRVKDAGETLMESRNGSGAVLGVPLRAGDDVVGVLELWGGRVGHPSVHAGVEVAAGLAAGVLRAVRSEERAAIYRETVRPSEDDLPAITYIDAPDGPGVTLYISPQAERLLGYTVQECLNDPNLWERLLHPEDRDRVITQHTEATERREPFRAEYRVVTKDGRVRWFMDEAVLVQEDGHPRFWRGHMIDVTERKEAEGALAEVEARFQALVENIPAITYIEDLEEGRMLYVSPQIEAISGYPAEERVANSRLWADIVHPDDMPAYRAADEHVTATGEPFSLEYRVVARDGRLVWLHDEAVMIRDPDGRPKYWQGVATDITERRAIEQERQRLLANLVSAQEEERARIAADVHDDPVQKMTVVDLRMQMLRAHLRDEGAALLDGLQSTVREAISAMRGLLVELRPPALDDGLASALRDLIASTSRDGYLPIVVRDTEVTCEAQLPVRTVAYRIAQEAIVNARTHAHASGVEVRIACRDGGLHLRIEDDGVGFDAASFKPQPGHIGMLAMRERAELAGGWLKVQSAPGEGTAIEFWLPD